MTLPEGKISFDLPRRQVKQIINRNAPCYLGFFTFDLHFLLLISLSITQGALAQNVGAVGRVDLCSKEISLITLKERFSCTSLTFCNFGERQFCSNVRGTTERGETWKEIKLVLHQSCRQKQMMIRALLFLLHFSVLSKRARQRTKMNFIFLSETHYTSVFSSLFSITRKKEVEVKKK